jgi:release factor glutamine methyltransferase
VSPAVLTPRPETETVLQVVLARFETQRRFTVLDLGVGSGALLLAILAERPLAIGVGVDISEPALAVAKENATGLGLDKRTGFVRGNWAAAVASETFDLAVCNPPYIPSGDIAGLDPEVRDHEPRIALDGGDDGLGAYTSVAEQMLRVLRPGGFFVVEIGPGQLAAVRDLFEGAGACGLGASRDLAGRERVVWGHKKSLGETRPNR